MAKLYLSKSKRRRGTLNHKELAKGIMDFSGGIENITNVELDDLCICINLNNYHIVDIPSMKVLKEVEDVFIKSGQLHIILRAEVTEVYDYIQLCLEQKQRTASEKHQFTIEVASHFFMKSYRNILSFKTNEKVELRNITNQIQEEIIKSGIQDGIVLVNARSNTSSIFINYDEERLHNDFKNWLEKIAPKYPLCQYEHNETEDNADSHLKRSIMGRCVTCAISNGILDLGLWERIFYFEFDGCRKKDILVKAIGIQTTKKERN